MRESNGEAVDMSMSVRQHSQDALVWLRKHGRQQEASTSPRKKIGQEDGNFRPAEQAVCSDQRAGGACRSGPPEGSRDLKKDVEAARREAETNAEALRDSADAGAAEVSAWWIDVSRSWDEHLAKVRNHVDQKIAEHDLNTAKRDAEQANAYAAYLIDYCYAAVQEAEYAVLDATLAQMQYDDLAAKQAN
jgi:hypothetical protein